MQNSLLYYKICLTNIHQQELSCRIKLLNHYTIVLLLCYFRGSKTEITEGLSVHVSACKCRFMCACLFKSPSLFHLSILSIFILGICFTVYCGSGSLQTSATHILNNVFENNFNQSKQCNLALILLLQKKFTWFDFIRSKINLHSMRH